MILRFSVEPPPGAGEPFEARYDGSGVTSNRDGDWKPDPRFTIADLVMPEQNFIEWDIRPLESTDVGDMNPNHDPKTGQFTSGLYAGTAESKRGGKRKSSRHEVFAHSPEEAKQIIAGRHRDEHKLMPSDFVFVGSFQYLGKDKTPTPPPPKPPNRNSKEWKARQEMQARVDEQKGYKGD